MEERMYKIPEDGEDNSKPNETAEVVTRETAEETAEETNTELLQSIDKKLDLLLAAQAASAKEE